MGENCTKQQCSTAEFCSDAGDLRRQSIWTTVDCPPLGPVDADLPWLAPASLAADGLAGERPGFLPGQPPELTCRRFALVRTHRSAGDLADWRRWYRLGRELGSGQSAVAYEAYAVRAGDELGGQGDGVHPGTDAAGSGSSQAQASSGSRRVALKRFRQRGTAAFQQELKVLLWTGTHPHILRLLEAFEGEEDALVLEHCELGDMYEYFVRHRRQGLPEEHVADLMRQLLLALRHLGRRRVEHRDVKPENLLLYPRPDDGGIPLLKLADFGWATIAGWEGKGKHLPPEGVGSLWYAAPELNPPSPGATPPSIGEAPVGASDMWSVGVIAYLLLTGHSPFNLALRIRDPTDREAEIVRLAAAGHINLESQSWLQLPKVARRFVCALLQPMAAERLSVEEALSHPFLERAGHARPPARGMPEEPAVPPAATLALPPPRAPPAAAAAAKRAAWDGLDGLQKLGWLAIACAITEPELCGGWLLPGDPIAPMVEAGLPTSYVEELAVELVAASVPAWFQPQAAWADIIQLAFRYLDVGMDGWLTPDDLAHHVMGEDPTGTTRAWLEQRWCQGKVGCAEFIKALHPQAAGGVVACRSAAGDDEFAVPAQFAELESSCMRFLDEEPGLLILDGLTEGPAQEEQGDEEEEEEEGDLQPL